MPLSVNELRAQVQNVSNLPTLPSVVHFVSQMVEDGEASASEIGEVISRDQVLSARLLRMVNSPFYGFPGRISSVTHAVVLLGFNVVKGLILSTSVFERLGNQDKGLWHHCLGTAIISREIAKELKFCDPEEFMVAGLLHDIGKVILAHLAPENAAAVTQVAEVKRIHVLQAERELLGLDHCEVAAWAAEAWRLPESLTDALAWHHAPHLAKKGREAATVVHLADILARSMDYGYPGDPAMPRIEREAFNYLGISYGQIDRVLTESETRYQLGIGAFSSTV